MAFIVTEKCIQCKFGDCIEICPTDCFYKINNMLVIDPSECIDCALCQNECPINAISFEKNLLNKYIKFIKINKILINLGNKIIKLKQNKLIQDSEKWIKIKNKKKYIILI